MVTKPRVLIKLNYAGIGACVLQPGLIYFPISMCLTFAESVFIAACCESAFNRFTHVVIDDVRSVFFLIWRSARNITRVSIHSEKTVPRGQRRGWWDPSSYPTQSRNRTTSHATCNPASPRNATGESAVAGPWWAGMVSKTRSMFKTGGDPIGPLRRKTSVPGPVPLQQPPRSQFNGDQAPGPSSPPPQATDLTRRPSKLRRRPTNNGSISNSALGGTRSSQVYGANMLLQTVIRDEVCPLLHGNGNTALTHSFLG